MTVGLLVLGSVALSGLSSCKKDYTCRCETVSGTVYDSKIKTTKKKAKAFCDEQKTSTRTCVLQ